MKTLLRFVSALAILATTSVAAFADLAVGTAAPAIIAKDLSGKEWKLADQKGKYVVLEWYNPDCPYVKHIYKDSSVQARQKKLADDGIVWVSVYSGKNKTADLQKVAEKWKSTPSVTLYDDTAAVARAYSAKTTPHIFIINPEGVLIYRGAYNADSKNTQSENYIDQVLAEAKAGKAVSQPVTKPYGCGVKY